MIKISVVLFSELFFDHAKYALKLRPCYTSYFCCNLHAILNGKPRSASEGRLQLDGGFLKNEAIHCYKHKSHCQIEPMKITLPSYCEPTLLNITLSEKQSQKHCEHGPHSTLWTLSLHNILSRNEKCIENATSNRITGNLKPNLKASPSLFTHAKSAQSINHDIN